MSTKFWSWKTLLSPSTLLSVASLVGVAVVYPTLPEVVPLHWNARGEIDGTGPRWSMLLLGALPLLLSFLFAALPYLDPQRESYVKHAKAYRVVVFGLTLFLIAVSWLSVVAAWGVNVPMEVIVPSLVGLLFVLMGNVLPQARFNYTFGIRTPWTLASEESWRRTHRVGGVVFVLMGLIFLGVAWLPLPAEPKWLVGVGAILLMTAGLVVYSYVVYRRTKAS